MKQYEFISKNEADTKQLAKKLLKEEKGKIIITGGYPFSDTKHTNFMKIEEL